MNEILDDLYNDYLYYLHKSEENTEDSAGYFHQACQVYDEYEKLLAETEEE